MRGLEGRWLLHADSGQLSDVEEAPPVDSIASVPPPIEHEVLSCKERVERIGIVKSVESGRSNLRFVYGPDWE